MRHRGEWTPKNVVAALLAATLAVTAGARADDFDDDFGEGPAPAEQPPSKIADPFEDDFGGGEAQPPPASSTGGDFGDAAASGEAAPATSTEAPPVGHDFDDDFQDSAAAGEQGESKAAAEGETASGGGDDDERRRREQLRTHNSYLGPTGGVRVVDAAGGAPDSFRFALATELFIKDGFLLEDDNHSRTGGALSFSYTPTNYLEIAASIVAYASANDREEPNLFQVLGDTRLFLRGFGWVKPWLSLGGGFELALLNSVGDIGLSGKGTSYGLRLAASADLRRIPADLPLIFRLNARYYVDNSAKLVRSVERARYDNLLDPLSVADEHRHQLTPAERYAFTINRVDTWSLSMGFEAPLRVKGNYFLHPLVEWSIALPMNRQRYNCVLRPFDATDPESCLAVERFSGRSSTLTLGLRFLPAVRGLSLLTAFDIATGGHKTVVRELAPTSAWTWLNGFSYAYDLRPPKPKEVIREVDRPQLQSVQLARIRGHVVETGSEIPIAEAVVRFEDPELSPVLSSADGSFVSYSFDPGTSMTLSLSSAEHEPGTCEVTLPEDGGDAEATCPLVALPKLGSVHITLRDDKDGTLGDVKFVLAGPTSTLDATTSGNGEVLLADLEPGNYVAQIEDKNHLARRAPFRVEARETTKVDIALLRRPKASLVKLSKKRIGIKRRVLFELNSAKIKVQSHALLAQVADVLLRHDEVRRVEVQGHTDNTGRSAHNQGLSQARAESVRQWLLEAGVEPERMTAVGYGDKRPRVPNITSVNRRRNRRVQFEILERDDAAAAE